MTTRPTFEESARERARFLEDNPHQLRRIPFSEHAWHTLKLTGDDPLAYLGVPGHESSYARGQREDQARHERWYAERQAERVRNEMEAAKSENQELRRLLRLPPRYTYD